jgi:hypothetical protein
MKAFIVEIGSDGTRIWRWTFVSRIKNNTVRRLGMLLTLPFMLLYNHLAILWPYAWRAVLFPLAYTVWCCRQHAQTIGSVKQRWNEPYTEPAQQQGRSDEGRGS